MANKFKVKTPAGYIVVEEKGSEGDYPGVHVYLTNNPEKDYACGDNMIACVEYDSSDEEIKTETYSAKYDEPIHIICYDSGHDML